MEKSGVGEQIPVHAPHARLDDDADKGLKDGPKVGPQPPLIPTGVPLPHHAQIAPQRAVAANFPECINRRFKTVIAAQLIQTERGGVELGVGSRGHQTVRMLRENRLAGIQRDDLHAPERPGKARLGQLGGDLRLQLRQRVRGAEVLRAHQIRSRKDAQNNRSHNNESFHDFLSGR